MKIIFLSLILSFIIAQDSIEVSPSVQDVGDPSISGCTDSKACNYNDNATEDDGSCTYAEKNYYCNGKCKVELDCNGKCGGSAKYDECGICGGDNSSCADCAGIPNGNNVKDNCGTCDTDDSNDCVQDCAGNWGGDLTIDECGICDGDNSSCTDKCGVLNGDNSSCADCKGIPNGYTVVDCAGVCGGASEADNCGICNGNGSSCLPYSIVDYAIVAIGLLSFAFSLTLTL